MSTIVIPTLHNQMSSFDPYNSAYQYTSSLFTSQEHYVHHNPALSTSAFSPVASLQVEPSWLSSSFHEHAVAQQQNIAGASAAAATTQPSAAFLPPSEDVLSLDTSHFAIPPLAGARNRTRPLPRRFHSFSTTATTRMQRRATDPTRGAQTNQRISRQAFPSPPSAGRQRPSPVGAHFTPSPPLQDTSDGRSAKRRRTEDLVSLGEHQQQQQQFTAPPGSIHVISPTTQHPHNPQLHEHGFGASQTWAGPPTGGHHLTSAVLPITGHHGLAPNPVGAPHWPTVSLHYYPAASPHQHAFHESQVSPQDLVQQSMIPYESPTSLSGSPFYPNAVSPSGDSAHSFAKKVEPSSPGLNPEPNTDEFDHPPTDFPPRPYTGGPNAKSPWTPVKPVGKIFGSRLEQMPAIEQRLAKLEEDLDHYLDVRAAQALKNSQLPGLSFEPAPIQAKPTGPSRLFGGRIWPTALARRVRRTPRD